MRPDFNICDRCKVERAPRGCSTFIATGTAMDAAGDSDIAGETVDLCNQCAVQVISMIVCGKSPTGSPNQPDYEIGRRILREIRSHKRP